MSKDDKKHSNVMTDIVNWIKSRSKKSKEVEKSKKSEEATEEVYKPAEQEVVTNNEGQKYELSQDPEDITYTYYFIENCDDESKSYWGRRTLRRIVALKDIVDSEGNVLVHKGDKGGFVESTDNLSQEGTCWVYDDACVYEGGLVTDNARASERAKIYGGAKLFDNSRASDDAVICFGSELHNNASVSEKASIGFVKECYYSKTIDKTLYYEKIYIDHDYAKNEKYEDHINDKDIVKLYDDSKAFGSAGLSYGTILRNNSKVHGNASVSQSNLFDSAEVHDYANVSQSNLFNSAKVFGTVNLSQSKIYGSAYVSGDLDISGSEIYQSLDNEVATNPKGFKIEDRCYSVGCVRRYAIVNQVVPMLKLTSKATTSSDDAPAPTSDGE